MSELNHTELLEVQEVVSKSKAEYCAQHCEEHFINHKQLNSILYVIGTVIVGCCIIAVGWGIVQSNATAAVTVKTDRCITDLDRVKMQVDDLQTMKNNTDSIYMLVKTIAQSQSLKKR